MTIRNVLLKKENETLTLQATVQFNGKPEVIAYFSIDVKDEAFVINDASPFLASFLLPCMRIKEDMIIYGSVSSKLFNSISDIQKLVLRWDIGLSEITVNATNIQDSVTPQYTSCFFSVGVDSFYTYLTNASNITHLLFVNGFDLPLSNTALSSKMRDVVLEIAQKENKKCLFVSTNVADIIQKILVWDLGHGGALAGVGLFLRGGLKQIYISSAVRYDELFPYGTHPSLDPLWSSENTEFIHFGIKYNRFEKILHSISSSNLALSHLHVCAQNRLGQYNCSNCYKCLITMIEMVCANVFDQAQTFQHPLDLEKVKHMYYDYRLLYNKQGEAVLSYLKNNNRESKLQTSIAMSLEKSKKRSLKRLISMFASHMDQTYNNRRLYHFVFQLNKKQDRNIFFKILKKGGFLK